MKIAIAVHGRFHAFDMALALIDRGHDVCVFTNYPQWATRRFGLPDRCLRSFWPHGILTRAAGKLDLTDRFEELSHVSFGRWAAREIRKEQWDVAIAFSGVAEEMLRLPTSIVRLRIVKRCSSHIRLQDRLLSEESGRAGYPIPRPSAWMIAREEREYAVADRVMTVSTFTHNSFRGEGFPEERLCMLPLAVETKRFRPPEPVVAERARRIRAGDPLRILYVGSLSLRKGIIDLCQLIEQSHGEPFLFRAVGEVPPESKKLLADLERGLEVIPRQPQFELPSFYAWGDLFVFPTIEDGFPVVLAQAGASGLPILTTPNGAGTDLIREGETGWVLPIRTPEAFLERLQWCDAHRDDLASMAERIYHEFHPRDWADVAQDIERLCAEYSATSHHGEPVKTASSEVA